ncbi:(+)-neomenthol dehydrogenase isoform X3 [Cryptomeria japonica]|uniref:(+)-neomenthol dehydrogenase isoform X3 n=1 Tax=Cryptomeria japonica TaxID=3369 RepID=UPI0027DA6679|nr:(+)-neomenthol dehydrogenase isoform X3 [Cryptomeria japonica]
MDHSESLNKRWWKEDTVGVVTGANKGIGYAIVRQLAENGICVILTARDEERGKAAAKTLSDEGFHNVVFHQLDVQDESSIQAFSNWVKEKYGKLDILVNNAGISGLEINYDILKANNTDPTKLITSGGTIEGISESYEKAEECIDINYYGTKRMVEALLPLLKLASEGGGRIVNMTSRAGVLEYIPSKILRQQLSNINDLTEERIDVFLQIFLKDYQKGLLKRNGWPILHSTYFISKATLNAYTCLLALQHPDLYVNCVHPGFVKTNMSLNVGSLSIDEGAKGPVILALLPLGSPSGQYYDQTEIASFDSLSKIDGLFA